MNKITITLDEAEVSALSAILEIALKAAGFGVMDAVVHFKNKVNTKIIQENEKEDIAKKAIEKTVTQVHHGTGDNIADNKKSKKK